MSMKTVVFMNTKEVRARKHDVQLLEDYSSESEEVVIYCSTNEREECERELGLSFDGDVLCAKSFASLAEWLRENSRLRLSGVVYT